MELRVLRYILAVTDAGTMTAAAQEMHVAQPSLSRQIKAFERTVGFDVFERNTHGITLTPAGLELVSRVRSLVEHADQVETTARQLAEGITARLAVHATVTIVNDVLAPFIAAELRDSDPHIDVLAVPSDDRHSGLDQDADLTIATYPPPQRFSARRLGFVPMYAEVHRTHRFAARPSVTIEDLLGEAVLVATNAHRTIAMLKRALHEYGGDLHRLTECPVPRVAQALAAAGRGVAVTSESPRFDLVAVPLVDADRSLGVDAWMAWRSDHVAARQIAGLARRFAHFHRGQAQAAHAS